MCRPRGTLFAQRGVCVGRSQDPSQLIEAGGTKTAMVTGPVQPLVVGAGRVCQIRKGWQRRRIRSV